MCLYGLEYLRALRDRVAVRVHNFEVKSQLSRGRLRRSRLLKLVIVVFGYERNEKSQLFHMQAPPSRARPFAFCLLASYGDYSSPGSRNSTLVTTWIAPAGATQLNPRTFAMPRIVVRPNPAQ